jgi:hypothetical protein
MKFRDPRKHDKGHLDFIRGLPCAICGDDTTVEAAHVRMMDPSIGKPMTGIGTKPHDKFTVPLCGEHHRRQHEVGDEELFWAGERMDPVKLSLALYSVSGDYSAGLMIVGR